MSKIDRDSAEPKALGMKLAAHIRGVFFGGNWTASNLKDQLAGVTWQQAISQVKSFHSIATLVFHVNYFVEAVLGVLKGGPLESKDEFSFDCPPIDSQEEWKAMLSGVFQNAEELASLVENLPDSQFSKPFVDEKYGDYFFNVSGIVEHTHYHLGQIAMIKKILG